MAEMSAHSVDDDLNYLNTLVSQPTIHVRNLGEISRAGLIGAPALYPNEKSINVKSVTPMTKGTKPFEQDMLRSSVIALMISKKNAQQTV